MSGSSEYLVRNVLDPTNLVSNNEMERNLVEKDFLIEKRQIVCVYSEEIDLVLHMHFFPSIQVRGLDFFQSRKKADRFLLKSEYRFSRTM
jgi:hypothetical protein